MKAQRRSPARIAQDTRKTAVGTRVVTKPDGPAQAAPGARAPKIDIALGKAPPLPRRLACSSIPKMDDANI